MREIKSNGFIDDFDPLTPTLSRWERERKRGLSRKERELADVLEISKMFG